MCTATNGASAMASKKNEFLAIWRKKKMLLQQSIVLYIRMHCADVTDITAKIVNSVHARSLGEHLSEFSWKKMGLSTENFCCIITSGGLVRGSY